MNIRTEDYEKIGTFYLGREYDLASQELEDELVLYDSKDLVTHGVVLGMTGSGKTGLCISLLEEAAMDSIPAIVIDPKGDIPNLLLTFPEFSGENFRPWINEDDARKKGKTPEEFAEAQAAMWKKGIGDWGQSEERVRQFRDKVDINIYTPGSSAGIPVSILSSLNAPPFEVLDDPELLGERVESTVTSLLGLMGIEADPIQSQEHIYLSQIFLTAWQKEEDLTLARLVHYIQNPPFDTVGVLPIDSFFPEKKRFAFSMQLNNLLASPGFQAWMRGVPLDIKSMMHGPDGKPRISIFSIAHLDDSERMFFVSLLLNQILSWMRAQSGTSSLRALLYMDEIFGFLPPVSNPPSKKPLMTMLKQARAYGLGLLLATQNPVDLDYKALSNIGTWFLGRLQTQRDKERVLAGLEGAASTQGGEFNKKEMEEILAGLDSRVFLMNNVHEDGAVIFHVRWVMSYLRGPLSRRQIKTLTDEKRVVNEVAAPAPAAMDAEEKPAESPGVVYQLPSSIEQVYFPVNVSTEEPIVYLPALYMPTEVLFDQAKYKLHGKRSLIWLVRLSEDNSLIDYGNARALSKTPGGVGREAPPRAAHSGLPDFAQKSTYYTRQKKSATDWIYHNYALEIRYAPDLKEYSHVDEDESDFRVRLQQSAREERDRQIEKLRQSYGSKIKSLEKKLESSLRALEREEEQARRAKMNTMISLGSTILGAVLGRKRFGIGTVSRGSSAARGVSRSWKEGRDVEHAESKAESYKQDLDEMENELEGEIERIREQLDPLSLPLETVRVSPYKKNIQIKRCALAWIPYARTSDTEVEPVWQPTV